MKGINLIKKVFLPLTAFIFGISFLSWAQDDEPGYELERIIVTATRTEVNQANVGASNSVITAKQINQSGQADAYESLRGVPGVTVSHSGSFGGLTDIYLRGAKPGHTLVMIDGVEVNDPMTTDRSFDFAHLPADNIERIEIIRGPQSTLYGSDAMSGVINVITKKGSGKPKIEASAESGTHDTFHESASLSGSREETDYSFSLGKFDSAGISMAKDGAERDKQNSYTISSRLGYKICDNTKLNLILHQYYSTTSLDDTAFDDDPNYTAWYRDLIGKFEVEQKFQPWWQHRLSFSHFEAKRRYQDEIDSVDTTDDTQSWYRGGNNRVEWQHNLNLAPWDTLTAGFDFNVERGSSYYRSGTSVSSLERRSVENKGYYLQNQFNFKERLFINPALRIDDHELFGAELTYKVSSMYLLRRLGTRLKFNIGTGFKAPSIYQLYSTEDYGGGPIGDPNLRPDKSKSYDFGFEQDFFERKVSFGTVFFHNKFKNMVDYDNKYKNIGKVKTRGIEFNSRFKPISKLDIGLAYTYTRTKDMESGQQLARRPQNQAGLDMNLLLTDNLSLNWKTVYVGHTWNDTANTQKVEPFNKSDIAVSYRLLRDSKFFVRVDNLMDRKYQEVLGYSTSGRSFYTGVKGEF